MKEELVEALSTFDWLVAISIFLVYTVIDGMYAIYTLAVAEKKVLRAANVGSIMYILISVGTIVYVDNFIYIIPLTLGAWVGTYLTLTFETKRKK